MSRDFWISVSRAAKRRQVFLIAVGAICFLAFFTWLVASRVVTFNDERSAVSIEPVVDGRFLGIEVLDNTHDQFMSNAEIRLAMNEGFKASNSIRKYQIERIWLQDGQHPVTGNPAVMVIVEPKRGEIPAPPFEPIAVRRWQPDPSDEFDLDELQRLRLINAPNEEDLERLREVWSGGKYANAGSLFGSIRRLFVFVALGMGLIIVAGAYRTLAWRSSRWDRAADVHRENAALSRLKSIRDDKRTRDSMDMS